MTVCTFYEQLGKFLGNRKNNEFPGKFMEITGREETTTVRKSFSSRNDRLSECVPYFPVYKSNSCISRP